MLSITALDNPRVKRARALHESSERRSSGCCLVEGLRAITACVNAGWQIAEVFICEGMQVPDQWPQENVIMTSERVLGKLSQAHSPAGYVAVFNVPKPPELKRAQGGLVLAGLGDPGNVGTLIRCAAAFALPQVVVVGGVDLFAHKVIQASAGAIAHIPVHRFSAEVGLAEVVGGAPCCGLVVRGGQEPNALPKRARWLVVGSEAHGLQERELAFCDEQLTLPMPGGTESLNAAMAGAIACYALFGPHS